MKRLFALCFFALCLSAGAQAQDSLFSWQAGVDVYYGSSSAWVVAGNRPFATQAVRNREFTMNYGFVRGQYDGAKLRGALSFQAGSYVPANYAAEGFPWMRLVGEASVGVKLAEGLWLDAGILPAHVGYENLLSIDNEVYTHSLLAEGSPYYSSGAQLSWQATEALSITAVLINGWQNITETNESPAGGLGVGYSVGDLEVGFSNYYGAENVFSVSPGGAQATGWRYFQNNYIKYGNERAHVGAAFDFGRQRVPSPSDGTEWNGWYGAFVVAEAKLGNTFAIAGRGELFNDPMGFIYNASIVGNGAGFSGGSGTLSFSYSPSPEVKWRVEGRQYRVNEESSLMLVTSLAARVGR